MLLRRARSKGNNLGCAFYCVKKSLYGLILYTKLWYITILDHVQYLWYNYITTCRYIMHSVFVVQL